jgi:hypothetical protein
MFGFSSLNFDPIDSQPLETEVLSILLNSVRSLKCHLSKCMIPIHDLSQSQNSLTNSCRVSCCFLDTSTWISYRHLTLNMYKTQPLIFLSETIFHHIFSALNGTYHPPIASPSKMRAQSQPSFPNHTSQAEANIVIPWYTKDWFLVSLRY